MIECPIDYYVDNIIFNANGSCWAVFTMAGYDYDFLSIEGKIRILHKTARFLTGVFSEAQVLIIPVGQNVQERLGALKERIPKDDVLYQAAVNYTDLTQNYLEDLIKARGASNDYKTYVIVKLETKEEAMDELNLKGFKEGFEYFLKNPMNAINVWLNLDTKDIMQSKLRLVTKMAKQWFNEQNARMGLSVPHTEEIQWLLRRMAYRGLNRKPKLYYASSDKKKKWQPAYEEKKIGEETVIRPLKKDIVNLFEGTIKTKNRVVTVTTEDSVSHQTFLVLTHIPDEIDFPGMEWIYHLQEIDMQAEICIYVKAIEYRKGLHKVDLKKRELGSQTQHESDSEGDVSEDLLEGRDYADLLEAELKQSKAPILNTSITICLASDKLELLEEMSTLVRNEYQDMNFGIERPLTDQKKLFLHFIPSVGMTIKDFILPMTPKSLAGGIIGATHELGSKTGYYIGTTGTEEKQVLLDLGEACLNNKSASATFYGGLGFGKSFNANLLVFLTVLYGGYGLIFDPKGERGHWAKELKILEGLITIVTLTAEKKFQGMLDPYNVYKDNIVEANELAVNVISELYKIKPTDVAYTALLEATRQIKLKAAEGERPSMKGLAKILNNFPKDDELYKEAKHLSRKLSLEEENGMSRLLIGDGTEASLNLSNRLNILQIQNMTLPSYDTEKKDYTAEEMRSTVIMMILSHFAKNFALVKRPVFKIILFDESWMLGKTSEGVKLYDFLSRMGRSLYTGCIFNGHSVLDLPTEAIRNTITYKFCFNTDSDKEAQRMLEYLSLENTKENRELIKALGNAECLFQDMNGRVGVLKFDAVFQDIINVFNTTPKTKEEKIKDPVKIRSRSIRSRSIRSKPARVQATEANVVNEEDLNIESVKEDDELIDIYQREEI